MTALLLVAAAVGYLYWTTAKKPAATVAIPRAEDLFRVPPPAPPAPGPDPRQAIDSLLAVRDRLAAAGPLDEQSSAAVDRLWLELLHGSARK